MAVLKSKDGTELLVDCNCGCDNGIRLRIDKDDTDYYCFASYTNGKFYTEQCQGMWRVFCRKLKKIWAIIRNKDFYYTEFFMTKDEFDEFKEYLNSIDKCTSKENKQSFIQIYSNDTFDVYYDKDTKRYHIDVFDDGYFWDKVSFDEHKAIDTNEESVRDYEPICIVN